MLNRDFECFSQTSNRRKIYYYNSYATLKNAFLNIDKVIATNTEAVLSENVKNNKSVFLIKLDSHQFVVERHRIKGVEKRLKHSIRNPAKKIWDNSNMLLRHDIPIVEPIALIQQYSLGMPKNEFLVNKYYDGMIGCDYFSTDSPMKAHWESAMKAMLDLTQKLKAAKITHDYFRSSNILMVNHKPLLLGVNDVNIFKGDEKTFHREHAFDIDYFYRYLRFSPDAKKQFENVFGLRGE